MEFIATMIRRPRTDAAKSKPIPVLIDRHVPVRSLRRALAGAGLRMDHDPITGLLHILPVP